MIIFCLIIFFDKTHSFRVIGVSKAWRPGRAVVKKFFDFAQILQVGKMGSNKHFFFHTSYQKYFSFSSYSDLKILTKFSTYHYMKQVVCDEFLKFIHRTERREIRIRKRCFKALQLIDTIYQILERKSLALLPFLKNTIYFIRNFCPKTHKRRKYLNLLEKIQYKKK